MANSQRLTRECRCVGFLIVCVGTFILSVHFRKYWNDLKKKQQKKGSELSEKIGQLKMIGFNAKEARMKLEAETGKKVVSPLNAKCILAIENKKEND